MTAAADYVRLTVDAALDDVGRRLGHGARVKVIGPVGSGRTTLARALEARDGAVVIEPPHLGEQDAMAHALYQAARHAGSDLDGSLSDAENARRIAGVLSAATRPLVLRLPASWRLDRRPRHDHEQRLMSAARDFIRAWFACEPLDVVLVADHSGGMPWCRDVVHLQQSAARREMLEDEALWGGYSDHARGLAREMGSGWNDPSAVSLRLGVGLVALGEPPSAVAQRLFVNQTPGSLIGGIVRRAGAHHLVEPLLRFLCIRSPVDPSWVERSVVPPAEHLPLFTSCLGYGDAVKVSSGARTTLHGQLASYALATEEVQRTHEALADCHERADGADDPANVGAAGIVHWLEKVHHLAHGGDACAERWSQQVLVHRDHLCERARVLSRVLHRYDEAASLYQRIVEDIDRADAYAWHYLGFNLDRAAQDRDRAEEALQRAVELDPSNPWWNSRYITFLVGQGRFGEAERAWESAIGQIDPDGDATRHDPELAKHLHRHVVRAWLEHGEVKRARRVLDRIVPPGTDLGEIHELDHLVRDAEEALALGASVRPPGMPQADRWRRSMLLDIDDQGVPLDRWFAGRVERVDARGVHVVFSTTEADQERRRLLRKCLPIQEWRAASRINADSAFGVFIEIGEYGDNVLVERVPEYAPPRWRHPDTRYLGVPRLTE